MVQTARPAPFSNAAPTDEAIDFNRRIAARLMQQGTSTEPVGHWTAALARALQGASGSMWNDQARQGEQDAEASVQAALSGKMDPKQLMMNPRTRGIGLQVWQSQQAEGRAARERAAAQNDPMRQLQLQNQQLMLDERKMELERRRRQQAMDDAVLMPGAAAPQQAPQQQPMPQMSPAMGARAAASEEGQSRVGGFAAPLVPPQPQAQPQQAPSNVPQSVQEVIALRDRLPAEQQLVFNQLWRRGQYDDALKLAQQAAAPSKKSVTELKQIYEADDAIPQLTTTLETLSRAEQLISPQAEKKGTAAYEGFGSGFAGYIGSRVPGGSNIFNETRSKATDEYGGLMTMEAVKAMAENLKGATTNFELQKFVEILADPSQPREIRRRTIARMRQLAQRQLDLATRRAQEIRSGQYYRTPTGQSGAAGVSTGRAIDLGDGFTVEIE